MKQICLDYYYERVSLRYEERSVHNIIKILVRSKKMYEAIDNIFIIFKLLKKLEVMIEFFNLDRKSGKKKA